MSKHVARVGLVLILLTGMTHPALPDPADWMEQVATQLLAALDDEGAGAEPSLESVLHENVDFAAIARGVMGAYRSAATVVQSARFQRTFEQSVIELLRSATGDLGDYQLSVGSARVPRAGRAQVPVVLTTSDGQTFEMQFSMAGVGGHWRVRNIIVGGVNLGVTFRNQFSELMKSHGGDVDAVIDAWTETMQSSNLVEADQAPGRGL